MDMVVEEKTCTKPFQPSAIRWFLLQRACSTARMPSYLKRDFSAVTKSVYMVLQGNRRRFDLILCVKWI